MNITNEDANDPQGKVRHNPRQEPRQEARQAPTKAATMPPFFWWVLLFAACFGSAVLSGAWVWMAAPRRAPLGAEIRYSERDGQTIEIWLQDQLTSEWEPRDGAHYAALKEVFEGAQQNVE